MSTDAELYFWLERRYRGWRPSRRSERWTVAIESSETPYRLTSSSMFGPEQISIPSARGGRRIIAALACLDPMIYVDHEWRDLSEASWQLVDETKIKLVVSGALEQQKNVAEKLTSALRSHRDDYVMDYMANQLLVARLRSLGYLPKEVEWI